jgi:hypothetical protein
MSVSASASASAAAAAAVVAAAVAPVIVTAATPEPAVSVPEMAEAARSAAVHANLAAQHSKEASVAAIAAVTTAKTNAAIAQAARIAMSAASSSQTAIWRATTAVEEAEKSKIGRQRQKASDRAMQAVIVATKAARCALDMQAAAATSVLNAILEQVIEPKKKVKVLDPVTTWNLNAEIPNPAVDLYPIAPLIVRKTLEDPLIDALTMASKIAKDAARAAMRWSGEAAFHHKMAIERIGKDGYGRQKLLGEYGRCISCRTLLSRITCIS